MRLSELAPWWLKRDDDTHFHMIDSLAEADGLEFLCPICFRDNGASVGTHRVICWKPHVPQTTTPTPGRWSMTGTNFEDVTLTGSVFLTTSPCAWHGYITNGEVKLGC